MLRRQQSSESVGVEPVAGLDLLLICEPLGCLHYRHALCSAMIDQYMLDFLNIGGTQYSSKFV